MSDVLVVLVLLASVPLWACAIITGISGSFAFRRYLKSLGEWVWPPHGRTFRDLRDGVEIWKRVLGRTPEHDVAAERERLLARSRLLRSARCMLGFCLVLGLAVLVHLL